MHNVQEIFRTVIDHKHYAVSTERSEFMCCALCFALMAHDISPDEFCAARRAVDEYLDELGAPQGGLMYHALQRIGACPEDMSASVWAPEDGKAFYYNWDERPRRGK
ncbi:hypothetical protein [Pseudomonas phage LKA1]|uniref:Glycosyl hydrolases family 22 (GH22) domain-containing protein n=1 Tax=Pseudomonas phage LKA1 TaxID=386793 RepID=Q0E609_9CAUD|nr:hypothetical protein AV952_gp05 [Pseudomonas phage LKA1]CAK24973.1 hypothetical protein [Pseudomonas phage LKA1]